MARVRVGGTSLEYVEHGQGGPVVLVHGSTSDLRTWSAQLRDFGTRYGVIAYSRRFHWPNPPIPEDADYSMGQHVDDLEAVMHALEVRPAHLVGHSYGAFVALLLAIRSPHLVRTLVLAEPPAVTLFVSNRPTPAEIAKLVLVRPRTAVAILKFVAKGVGPAAAAARRGDMEAAVRISGHAVLGREFYRRLSGARLEQVRANAIRAEFLGSGFAPLRDAELRGVETPTLLLTGQASPSLFHRVIDRLEELLPHVETVEIPAASHIMHEDNPRAYNSAVLSFLAAHRAA